MTRSRSRRYPLALAALAAACGGPRAATDAGETVYVLSPATWFEDGWSYYDVSPTRIMALYGARFGFRLLDLELGREDTVALRGALDEAVAAAFDRYGGLLRAGRRGRQTGWFVDGPAGPQLLPIPSRAEVRPAPDGAALAYFLPGERMLYLDRNGDPQRFELQGPVTGAAWSHDAAAVFALVLGPDGLSSLVRITPPDGRIHTVRDGLDAPERFNAIGVSPEGRRVFLALAGERVPDPLDRHRPDADRDTDIYALDLEQATLEPVVRLAEDDFAPDVAWEWLYWTHNELQDDVVIVPAEGGEARVLVERAQIPSWNHAGTHVAFTVGGWRIADWALNLDAAVVAVDGRARRISDPMPIVTGYHEDFTPAWSPDGRWIAYHSHRSPTPVPGYAAEGSTDDIYLRQPSAPMDQEIRLTDFGWEVGMADWAPDGRRLVFDSWDRGVPGIARPWIATIDPESGALVRAQRLPLPPGVEGSLLASWSPVEDEIAFVQRIAGERQALWVVAPDGSGARRIVEFRSSTYGGLDWTPDGQRLVYAALADGRMQLFAVPGAGGTPERLTDDPANLIHPQVSPDGRWIAATRLERSKQLRRIPLP
jgi:hypothetical protein